MLHLSIIPSGDFIKRCIPICCFCLWKNTYFFSLACQERLFAKPGLLTFGKSLLVASNNY